ncbi:MAG: hypothetical protein J6Q82_00890 [Clostridia bacterium]|nr:hypothetical protein [Clostridia bacterium]
MVAWWNSLGLALQIFYCVAIPASLVLVIQTVLMFFGFGEDAGGDIDVSDGVSGDGIFGENSVSDPESNFDVEGLRIFTLRGIVAFFVVFGWVGVVMLSAEVPLAITVAVAALGGFAMMLLLAFLTKMMMKLRNSGNIDVRNAVGTSGRVYLTIPPARSGEGKVQLVLQGSLVERAAVTDEETEIPTGSEVVVVSVSAGTDLVVRRK